MAEGLDGHHRTPSPVRSMWSGSRNETSDDSGVQSGASPRPHYYEELFCGGRGSTPVVPLAGALVASSAPQSDVVKQGYLGKQERGHRRYFVLRAGSHTGPSRLEWYRNLEKFTSWDRSASKTTLFGFNKQGVIYLRCCLGVSRTGSSRKGHVVVLYAKDQTVALVMDDQREQEDWYTSVKHLMEEEQRDEECDEEDDGYCTLPSSAYFKEVKHRLRLQDKWEEFKGDQASAQHIHEAVREAVGALRALPDFSRSPTSNHLQAVLPTKRCRPRCRDKLGTGRPHCSFPMLPVKPETRTSPTLPNPEIPSIPEDISSNTEERPAPHADRYMDMQVNHCSEAGSLQESWGMTEEEEEEEGPGYMLMSPQAGHSPPAPPVGDYMSMASPQRPKQLCFFSAPAVLQTSIDSSTSECSSPDRWPSTSAQQGHQIGFSARPSQHFCDPDRVPAPVNTSDPNPALKPRSAQSAPPPVHTESDPSIRGCWLSMCFLTCLQAKTES